MRATAYVLFIWIGLSLASCVANQTRPEGDIESARNRYMEDARYCVKTYFSGSNLRGPLTPDQLILLDTCLEQRGWLITGPPGPPGATFSCHAIDSGRGAYITFCP